MDYDSYRQSFFVEPRPEPRFHLKNTFGVTLYYESYKAAVEFYKSALGQPGYVEGEYTHGWAIGEGWLTLLKGDKGNPENVEITFEVETPAEAEALQQAFIAAGAKGTAPSDQLMYRPVRYCPVEDPFGGAVLIIAPIDDHL